MRTFVSWHPLGASLRASVRLRVATFEHDFLVIIISTRRHYFVFHWSARSCFLMMVPWTVTWGSWAEYSNPHFDVHWNRACDSREIVLGTHVMKTVEISSPSMWIAWRVSYTSYSLTLCAFSVSSSSSCNTGALCSSEMFFSMLLELCSHY